MAHLNPHYKRRKHLITYSRKVTRLLPLDGAQFLRGPSVFSETLSRTTLSENQDDHQSHLVAFDHTTNEAPSSAQTSYPSLPSRNPSSLFQTPVSTPTRYILRSPAVPEEDFDPSIFASPLSESEYDDGDSIVDDQRPVHGVKSARSEQTHGFRVPRMSLSVVRKALKLPETHRTTFRSTNQSTSTEADRLAMLRGSDGFTQSEMFSPLRPRRKKARASRFSKAVATLDVRKGPLPDVGFSVTTFIDSRLCLVSSADPDEAKDEILVCHQNAPASTIAEARQKPSSNDILVYAQLSSIRAPRQRSPVEISDDSENEDYQDELLGSVQSFSDNEDRETVSRTTSASDSVSDRMDKGLAPGQLPRQLLDDPKWIGVDEEILDDEPASKFSHSACAVCGLTHS